uniref:Uncharacterized protein n=1 Tax=Oryza sativa subsp. japonica TaxID=39947 RepID=Q6H7Z1_ORYSJ|nr:hypothetical protein [Oryza sativa Japonica Group]
MEENPRNEPTSAPPGAGNMTLYGHTMLYDEHQMMSDSTRIGQQCTFTGLMHEIMQTPKSAINADQDYLGMSRDILHTPAGFENSMIMTSNRFPENYEQMGGEIEQGTQAICDQWASKNIEELYNINMNNQQGLSSIIKTLASRWSKKDIDELYNINNTHQVVNGSTPEVENNVSASELENNGTTSNNQDDEDSENQNTWAFESNNETSEENSNPETESNQLITEQDIDNFLEEDEESTPTIDSKHMPHIGMQFKDYNEAHGFF